MSAEQNTEPLEIIIPNELYDDWIHTDFPLIQKNNRAAPDAPIYLDLRQCEWVSPLPFLVLATECMTYSSPNRHINIDVGAGGTGENAEKRSRVRKFLSLHGFLDAFASRKDLIVRFQFDPTDERGSEGLWHDASTNLRSMKEQLEKSRVDLIFGDTIVLPATTWMLPHSNDPNLSASVRKQVDRLLRRADIALFKFKTEARKYRNVTLQRLNQVLLELVENAAEHAYLDSAGGHVGLYARVRQTGSETASEFRAKELGRSPLLVNLLLSEKQHQIEVFVVDVGRGLFADIATWNSNIGEHQPLRKTAEMLFIQPLSRHDRTKESVSRQRGSSTGLMHLHNILSHQNDTSRIVARDEWLAGSHPRPQGFTSHSVTTGLYQQHVSGAIEGTLFHIGISPSEIPSLDSQWFVSDDASSALTRLSIIKKFASYQPTKPNKLETRVIDIRANEGLENIGSLVKKMASELAGTIVRVNRVAEKNLVNVIITAWINGLGESKQKTPVLFLCDLGRYQAVDVAWVVKKYFEGLMRFDLGNVPKEALIFLVTEDLCCTQFNARFNERDELSFSEWQFSDNCTIDALCNTLRKNRIAIRGNTVAELNKLLGQAGLYATIKGFDKNHTSSEYLNELEGAYNKNRTSSNLKKLNRIVLEEFYPIETPKSSISVGKYIVTVDQPVLDIEKLENRLVLILSELRNCDTKKLWASINRLNEEWPTNPVLIKNVRWGSHGAQTLPNYLNFSVLVQDDEAARCVRRSLRRILALFPDANDLALDGLVESSLHDAKKWLIRPQHKIVEQVLVGSLSVSGSTLNRYKPSPKNKIVGVIDCIKSPYYDKPKSNTPHHLAALLWDPTLDVVTNKPPQYQRIGKSAFVERICDEQKTLYDEKLYSEIESAKLVKIGHWVYGDRHCLLEINAEHAIEQSWESESGPIPWLAQKLTDLCKQQHVVLAFPVDKLAYRLAHHVRSRIGDVEKKKLTLLPLSYLPRVAGGMTKFAPLVFDAAKDLSKREGEVQPLAVFLDFGFITNRTMRHSVRQLHGAGFGQVKVMGMLNRSSAPSLAHETEPDTLTSTPIPQAYWRWNVPTMGSGTHCFVCNALPSLARLRRLSNEAHIDLLGPIEAVGRNWAARDVADFWDEYGLDPILLTDEMRQAITPLFRDVPSEGLPATSSALSARVVEYFRTTGDSTFPLSVARCLLSANGNEQAVELISTTLVLANSSFTPADMHEYIALLAKSAIDLGVQPYDPRSAERISRLLGLVALVFATRDSKCKLEAQEQLCLQLAAKDVSDIPHLRIALIALTTDSDESEEVQNVFHERCTANRSKTILIKNYHAIRSAKGTAKDTWAKLTQAFGRSESHSQNSALGGLIEEFSKSTEPSKTVPRIAHIASLLGQCDINFVMDCFEVDLDDVIKKVQKLSNEACTPLTPIGSFNESVNQTFHVIKAKLHSALKRFGHRANPMIYDLFYDTLIKQASANGMTFDEDIALTHSAATMEWCNELGGYLPICNQVTNLFSEIFSNIKGKSIKLPPPDLPEFSCLTKEVLGWIWFDTQYETQDKGITVVFVTGTNSQKDLPEYRPKIAGLSEWGVNVESRNIESVKRRYFEIRVRIPSLATILEEL